VEAFAVAVEPPRVAEQRRRGRRAFRLYPIKAHLRLGFNEKAPEAASHGSATLSRMGMARVARSSHG
jgi:hypothetical protein